MPDSNLMDRSHRTGGSANKELEPDGGNGQDLSWAWEDFRGNPGQPTGRESPRRCPPKYLLGLRTLVEMI